MLVTNSKRGSSIFFQNNFLTTKISREVSPRKNPLQIIYRINFFFLLNMIRKDAKSSLSTSEKNFKENHFALRGGGKKHKKKVYTKPKKKKHIPKKIKLRFLAYYKFNEGKLEKLRRSSPEAPGCFMAEHHNRITCGKTGLTFVRKL